MHTLIIGRKWCVGMRTMGRGRRNVRWLYFLQLGDVEAHSGDVSFSIIHMMIELVPRRLGKVCVSQRWIVQQSIASFWFLFSIVCVISFIPFCVFVCLTPNVVGGKVSLSLL